MPKSRLTAASIEKLKPPASGQVEVFDALLPSFGIRLSHSGTRAWFVMTRVNGRLRRFTLGRYPAMPLEAARKEARSTIEQAQRGVDRHKVRVEARRTAVLEGKDTFSVRVDQFFAEYVLAKGLRPTTVREYNRILRGPDTAFLRDRPIRKITKADVQQVLSAMQERGAHGAADRAKAYMSKFFAWCVDQEIIEASPVARIRLHRQAKSRDRVLSNAELKAIWLALEDEGGLFGPMFKLLLLTGQRRSEVAGMVWNEIEGLGTANAIWRLPGSRTKNHREHLVPLSEPAQAVIEALPRVGPYLFSGTGGTPASGFGKAKKRIDSHLPSGFTPWTLHDFRRTAVTVMNELGVAPHVVEAVVNHVSGEAKRGVAGVYNRALYLQERRDALCRWAEWLSAAAER